MRRFIIASLLTACSSPSPSAGTDARVTRTDAAPLVDCTPVHARATTGATVFGPQYGVFPEPTLPPIAFLAPGGDCIAVRVDTALQGVRLYLAGDEASNWSVLVGDAGAQTPVAATPVGDGVVEGMIDNVTDEYIRITASRADCAEARILTLRRFSDGKVAVVGYSSTDCQSSGPRSLSAFKKGIDYIDDAEREHLRDALLGLRLARYTYTDAPRGPRRLGVILDDTSTLGAPLTSDGTHIDIYAYASLAVATAQQQQRELDELRARVNALEAALRASSSTRR